MRAHALRELERGTKLTLGRLGSGVAGRRELRARLAGSLKRRRLRVDPRHQLKPAATRSGIGEIGHSVGAHAARELEPPAYTGGRRARPTRGSAGGEQEPTDERGKRASRGTAPQARVTHPGALYAAARNTPVTGVPTSVRPSGGGTL